MEGQELLWDFSPDNKIKMTAKGDSKSMFAVRVDSVRRVCNESRGGDLEERREDSFTRLFSVKKTFSIMEYRKFCLGMKLQLLGKM